jgi:glycosyltransferase involved in cell wall biosynthesis
VSARTIGCIVPALDAELTIAAVIDGIRHALPDAFIVAVDDGSRDATSRVARASADETVRFPVNRGKGAALRAGISEALARGCDRLVTIDADGQHDPRFAPQFIETLETADLVVGARRAAGPMPLGRRITNRLSARAVGRCVGQPIADAQCGFRAMRAPLARHVRPRADRYEYETEFLILAARSGYRLAFVPIPTAYPGAVPSRFRAIRDSARIIETIWRFRTGARAS